MRGVVYNGVTSPAPLQVMYKPRPEPRAGQVLIEVRASSVNVTDSMRFALSVPVARAMDAALRARGRPLGGEVSGVVAEVGPGVMPVKRGDPVVAYLGASGAWSEYMVADAKWVRPKPAGLTFAQAGGLLMAGLPAQGAVRAAGLRPGSRVLIHGASGGVGHLTVQIAHAVGAEVTAVCGPRNLELAKDWGADRVVDYTSEAFARAGAGYDAIIAVNGYNPIEVYKPLLADHGVLVPIGADRQHLVAMILSMATGPVQLLGSGRRLRPSAFPMELKGRNIDSLIRLADEGELTPYVDHVYSFEEAGEAIEYITHRHAQGKVIVAPDPQAASTR